MIDLRKLPLPCPINSMHGVMPIRVKGRYVHMKVLSKRARDRRKMIVAAIWEVLGGKPVALTGDVQVSYTITPRDRRTPDVDAYEKHLLDCLQHAGVIANDKQVVQVSKERMPTPQSPGHLDVQVWEVGES